MTTLGEQQAHKIFQEEEYNRENYRRWPWGSFAFAALCSGIIFLLASSPSSLTAMQPPQMALSIIFIIIGGILLVPTAFGMIFYFFYSLVRIVGWKCVCQDFADKFSYKKRDDKAKLSSASMHTESMTIWTSEASPGQRQSATPEQSHGGVRRAAPSHPPSYQEAMLEDQIPQARPPRNMHNIEPRGDEDNNVVQVVIEHDRNRGHHAKVHGRGDDRDRQQQQQRQPAPPGHRGSIDRQYETGELPARRGGTRDGSYQGQAQGRGQDAQGKLWRDREGNMVLHI